MKKVFILSYLLSLILFLALPKEMFSQNVGIGNSSPAEKLVEMVARDWLSFIIKE